MAKLYRGDLQHPAQDGQLPLRQGRKLGAPGGLARPLAGCNTQRHWAHEERKDGSRSPLEVLGSLKLLRHHPEDLERAFFSTRFVRRLDVLGYACLKHWRGLR